MHVKLECNFRDGERYGGALQALQQALADELHKESETGPPTTPTAPPVVLAPPPNRPTTGHLSLESWFGHEAVMGTLPSEAFSQDHLPLHHALSDASLKSSKALVSELQHYLHKGVNPNEQNNQGETPLLYVRNLLSHGHFALAEASARALLDAGATVDEVDQQGLTLLCHSVHYLDASAGLTRVLLNGGAGVWHSDKSPFSCFLKAVIRCRHVEGGVVTLALLGRVMGQKPSCMRAHVLRNMLRQGKYYRILGPVFLQVKSLLVPYWSKPTSLQYACWKSIRQNLHQRHIASKVQQLAVPPSIQRYLTMEDV